MARARACGQVCGPKARRLAARGQQRWSPARRRRRSRRPACRHAVVAQGGRCGRRSRARPGALPCSSQAIRWASARCGPERLGLGRLAGLAGLDLDHLDRAQAQRAAGGGRPLGIVARQRRPRARGPACRRDDARRQIAQAAQLAAAGAAARPTRSFRCCRRRAPRGGTGGRSRRRRRSAPSRSAAGPRPGRGRSRRPSARAAGGRPWRRHGGASGRTRRSCASATELLSFRSMKTTSWALSSSSRARIRSLKSPCSAGLNG